MVNNIGPSAFPQRQTVVRVLFVDHSDDPQALGTVPVDGGGKAMLVTTREISFAPRQAVDIGRRGTVRI